MAARFKLDKQNGLEIVKVAAWSGASAVITVLIAALANADVPMQYAFLVSIANIILVSSKKFLENKVSEGETFVG